MNCQDWPRAPEPLVTAPVVSLAVFAKLISSASGRRDISGFRRSVGRGRCGFGSLGRWRRACGEAVAMSSLWSPQGRISRYSHWRFPLDFLAEAAPRAAARTIIDLRACITMGEEGEKGYGRS